MVLRLILSAYLPVDSLSLILLQHFLYFRLINLNLSPRVVLQLNHYLHEGLFLIEILWLLFRSRHLVQFFLFKLGPVGQVLCLNQGLWVHFYILIDACSLQTVGPVLYLNRGLCVHFDIVDETAEAKLKERHHPALSFFPPF